MIRGHGSTSHDFEQKCDSVTRGLCLQVPALPISEEDSLAQFRMTLHNHVKKRRNGVGLPGPVRRPKVQQVAGGAKNMAWKCPRCKLGVSHTLRQSVSKTVFAQMRRDRRVSHHAEISKEEWSSISWVKPTPCAKQPLEFRRSFAEGCRRRQLVKGVLREVGTPRFPGFQMFIWPVAKHLPGPKGKPKKKQSEKPIHRISLEHGWKCMSCEFASRSLGDVRTHAKSKCTPPKLARISKKRRMGPFENGLPLPICKRRRRLNLQLRLTRPLLRSPRFPVLASLHQHFERELEQNWCLQNTSCQLLCCRPSL